MLALGVKSNYFLNIQSVYKKVSGADNFVTFCFYLVKMLPTSDQFNSYFLEYVC